MQTAIVVTGRLVGPRNVELDEPVSCASGRVEVIVRESAGAECGRISDFLRGLPAGRRSKEEIDRDVLKERDSWGDVE